MLYLHYYKQGHLHYYKQGHLWFHKQEKEEEKAERHCVGAAEDYMT